ncbi:TonB-dependent receptor [Pedobacter sp. PAMC26386]|nr:TonB-dependent receptor [Pedobacter sp. PAMC26386]
MKLKLMVILTIWMTFASNLIYAQLKNAIISGHIADADGKTFDLATVALFTIKDSVLVKTSFTQADGKFSFPGIGPGVYQIRASAMGYANYRSAILQVDGSGNHIDLPEIKLTVISKNLKEVNITAQKAFVEHKIDRTVINVDALISNAGTSALDVLGKSPGVSVDQNGLISLKGKQGVTIFIDGKPTYLSGADLEAYLRAIPSSSLDQLEIMTNPPAKYDASGNGGVINIKTKKGSIRGFNGGLNLSLSQGKMTRSLNSMNLNFRNSKFNYFANLSYNRNNSFTDLDLNRTYKNSDGSPASYFNQNSYIKRNTNAYNIKAGADYYQSDQTTWGVVLTGMLRNGGDSNNNTSNLFNSSRQLDSIITAKNINKIDFKNGAVNLNYRHQFAKKGQEITADADYLRYKNQTDQLYDNASFFADGRAKSNDILTGFLPSNIDIYSLKTDYSDELKNEWKFAAGLKKSYTKTDNIANYFYTLNEVTKPDYDKSNHFLYKENINAAYVNINKDYKMIAIQAGLRAENTISNGHQLGNLLKPDSSFKRSYTGLFPTLYVLYKLDTAGNHKIGLNYGRRIDRPYYQDLNPFVSPLDKFTYYVGNPFLKPSYTQSLELSHSYKNRYTTTLSYSNSKDDVNETIEILNGKYFSRPANIGRKIVKSLSFNGTFDPLKWLNINLYSELTNLTSKSDFYTGKLNTSGTYVYVSSILKLTIGDGWDGELNGNYRSKLRDAQFVMSSLWLANAAVQKKISKKATLKLSINDIFYSSIYKGVINNLALTEANWINKGDSRRAVLSFSYRFGKDFSTPAKHEGTGAESEKSRVRN